MRRNSDEGLRGHERAAAAGDPQAEARLAVARERADGAVSSLRAWISETLAEANGSRQQGLAWRSLVRDAVFRAAGMELYGARGGPLAYHPSGRLGTRGERPHQGLPLRSWFAGAWSQPRETMEERHVDVLETTYVLAVWEDETRSVVLGIRRAPGFVLDRGYLRAPMLIRPWPQLERMIPEEREVDETEANWAGDRDEGDNRVAAALNAANTVWRAWCRNMGDEASDGIRIPLEVVNRWRLLERLEDPSAPNPAKRRNADADLRELLRRAAATRDPDDIERYEAAATRAGLRRSMSVRELMDPRRVPADEGGVFLGMPVQIEGVWAEETLRESSALERSMHGVGPFHFGVTGKADDDKMSWARFQKLNGTWGRAVDPPGEYVWDNRLSRRVLTEEPDHHLGRWLVPVSVESMPGKRFFAARVWSWTTALPPWATDIPIVQRSAGLTGYMTGFLATDMPRRNPLADSDDLAQHLYDAGFTAVEIPQSKVNLSTADRGHPVVDEPERYRWFLISRFPVRHFGLRLHDLMKDSCDPSHEKWRHDKIVDLLRAGPAWPAVVTASGVLVDGFHRVAANRTLKRETMPVVVAVERSGTGLWDDMWLDGATTP